MANPRDDMVIKIRATRRDEKPVRERAEEEKRTTQTKRRRGGMLRRLRLARLLRARRAGQATRRSLRAGRTARGRAARASAVRGAARGAGRALGLLGIIMETVIVAGYAARRLGGESGRFVAATDAHTLLGTIDEAATATANARGFIESNGYLLRIIAQQGKVNSQILRIANDMKVSAQHRAMGSDLIARDPQFDSADTVIDLLIKKARAIGLPEAATRAGQMIRTSGRMTTLKGFKTSR